MLPLSQASNLIVRITVSSIVSCSAERFPRISSACTVRIYFLFLSFFGFGYSMISFPAWNGISVVPTTVAQFVPSASHSCIL